MKVLFLEYCQPSQLNEKICEDGQRRALFAQHIFSKMTAKQPEQHDKTVSPAVCAGGYRQDWALGCTLGT